MTGITRINGDIIICAVIYPQEYNGMVVIFFPLFLFEQKFLLTFHLIFNLLLYGVHKLSYFFYIIIIVPIIL